MVTRMGGGPAPVEPGGAGFWPLIERGPALTGPALWFSRVTTAGILANVVAALISLANTQGVISFLNLDPAQPLVWPRFAAFLLILLSLFYIPAAVNPLTNRYSAVFSILARAGGVAFFSIVGGRYIVFGLFDLAFGLPQAILLAAALRGQSSR